MEALTRIGRAAEVKTEKRGAFLERVLIAAVERQPARQPATQLQLQRMVGAERTAVSHAHLVACGLTTKKFAGRPAAMALLRNVKLLSRSPAALAFRIFAALAVTVVELTKFGFGFVCTSRPASVGLVHVAAPPV